MLNRSTDENNTKPDKSFGLYVHKYALDLMRAGAISPRGLILLAHVDRLINPYKNRHPEMFENHDDDPPPESVFFTAEYLRSILAVQTNDTVRQTINQLRKVKPKIFQARKMGRDWELKTKKREYEQGALHIRHDFKLAFEHGKITAREMLLISEVLSFERNGRRCFLSNRRLAENLGTTAHTVKNCVSDLVKRGILKPEYSGSPSYHARRYLRVAGHFDFERTEKQADPVTPEQIEKLDTEDSEDWRSMIFRDDGPSFIDEDEDYGFDDEEDYGLEHEALQISSEFEVRCLPFRANLKYGWNEFQVHITSILQVQFYK